MPKSSAKPSLIGMIISPKLTIKRIKERPLFWGAFIMFTVLAAIFIILINYDQMRSYGMIEYFLFSVSALLTTPIMILVSAFLIWALIFVLKGLATYRQILSLQTYVYSITILSLFVHMLIFFITGGQDMRLMSLGGILPVTGVVELVLGTIDLFFIWSMVLIALGLKEIANLSMRKAWIVVILYLFVNMLFVVIQYYLG